MAMKGSETTVQKKKKKERAREEELMRCKSVLPWLLNKVSIELKESLFLFLRPNFPTLSLYASMSL